MYKQIVRFPQINDVISDRNGRTWLKKLRNGVVKWKNCNRFEPKWTRFDIIIIKLFDLCYKKKIIYLTRATNHRIVMNPLDENSKWVKKIFCLRAVRAFMIIIRIVGFTFVIFETFFNGDSANSRRQSKAISHASETDRWQYFKYEKTDQFNSTATCFTHLLCVCVRNRTFRERDRKRQHHIYILIVDTVAQTASMLRENFSIQYLKISIVAAITPKMMTKC